ncbi:hypothetical protein BDW22DRAFT_1357819 [Trametopsis cervina]|nr:hypothetical protein BDW22DRAFT_1357819 [Trametopsis cervina]
MSHNAILQNSPALHSLKREQLVKLCKKHSLKANGKNVELIERLKQRAAELPAEAFNYQWKDSDDEQDGSMSPDPFLVHPPRPSEQWEIVMENIAEVEENGMSAMSTLTSMRTVGNAGEFGTGGSKNSVKSSLKAAIANSFGIKRAGSSKPGSQVGSINTLGTSSGSEHTPMNEDRGPFDFPTSPELEPIPGTSARPGAPAPTNARLSTGTGAKPGLTTTIRLISSNPTVTSNMMPTPPRLAPFHTTFDLDMSSPDGGAKRHVWPASPMGTNKTRKTANLYPAIPFEDLAPTPFRSNFGTPGAPSISVSHATPAKSPFIHGKPADDVDDVFSPVKPTAQRPEQKTEHKEHRLSMPNNQPFLFGSPLPQPTFSTKQFNAAAASVLEEMNKRLQEAGVQKVEKTVLDGGDKARVTEADNQRKDDAAAAVDRFAKAHEKAFDKMDSIANHYAARRPLPAPPGGIGKKRKSDAAGLGHGPAPNDKRKSSVAETRVISNGVRKKMGIPGAFGEDDDDDDDGDQEEEDPGERRSSKRIRVAENEDIHKGRRVSLLHTQKTVEEIKKQEREREVARKHLNAARRRSSRNRASMAGKAIPPPKPSRFGFLASAKSLVRNVWNMGAGNVKAPSGIPVAKPVTKPTPVVSKSKLTKAAPAAVASTSTSNPSSSLLKPSSAAGKVDNGSANSASRARSPIPSFTSPPPVARVNSAPGATAPLNVKPRSSTLGMNRAKAPPVQGSSSLGARTSIVGSSKTSSIGEARIPGIAFDEPSSDNGKSPMPPRKRTMSTLMQPTASSLAKQSLVRPDSTSKPLPVAGEGSSRVFSPTTLRPITNGPLSPASPTSKIFTRPLTADTFTKPQSVVPKQRITSLGAAAASMLENNPPIRPRTNAPLAARKPRVSRSRVIAKLNQQRAAAGNAGPATSAIARPVAIRSRSSIGATPRRSLGVMKNQRTSAGGEALKKRNRQSEFARRKSRAARSSVGLAAANAMDVDV